MTSWDAIAAAIGHATQARFEFARTTPLSGGCINQTYRISSQDGRHFFAKLNDAHKLPMFTAESAGLEAIAAARTVRVPQPIIHGTTGQHAFLVLEYLDLSGSGDARLLGEQLAALHRCTGKNFGFAQDNFIGTTPQPNAWTDDWIFFWCEWRLGFQLDLAVRNGYGGKLQEMGRRLMGRLPEFFDGYLLNQRSLLKFDPTLGISACMCALICYPELAISMISGRQFLSPDPILTHFQTGRDVRAARTRGR